MTEEKKKKKKLTLSGVTTKTPNASQIMHKVEEKLLLL